MSNRSVQSRLGAVLAGAISLLTLESVLSRLGPLGLREVSKLSEGERQRILATVGAAIRLFARGDKSALVESCSRALSGSDDAAAPAAIDHVEIEGEDDIAAARLAAMLAATRLGLSRFAAAKIATAVSELARNVFFYAGRGHVAWQVAEVEGRARLVVEAVDRGPGIPAEVLAAIEAGTYRSRRGMGQGLVAVRRLADGFELETKPGEGTIVRCEFLLSL